MQFKSWMFQIYFFPNLVVLNFIKIFSVWSFSNFLKPFFKFCIIFNFWKFINFTNVVTCAWLDILNFLNMLLNPHIKLQNIAYLDKFQSSTIRKISMSTHPFGSPTTTFTYKILLGTTLKKLIIGIFQCGLQHRKISHIIYMIFFFTPKYISMSFS